MMSLTASIGLWPGLPSPPPQQKGDEDWVGRSSAPSRPLGGSWATSVQGWRAREPAGLRTGPDGMSYDVDDDAGNAEVRHPGDRVLGERKRVHICSLHLQGQGWKGAVGAGWGWHGEAGTVRPAQVRPAQVGLPLTCRASATVITQQAAKQMEKPRRRSSLLPNSSTTNTCQG